MKKYLIYFYFALLTLHSSAAQAFTNDGVEIEPLFFGQVIITDTVSHSCTIPAGGTMTCDDPHMVILNPGRYGVFRLSGFNPAVAISAYVDDTTTTLTDTGGATVFDIKNFTFAPAISSMGGTPEDPPGGTLTIEIGATLKTRAGTTYDIAPYRGTFDLQINY